MFHRILCIVSCAPRMMAFVMHVAAVDRSTLDARGEPGDEYNIRAFIYYSTCAPQQIRTMCPRLPGAGLTKNWNNIHNNIPHHTGAARYNEMQ